MARTEPDGDDGTIREVLPARCPNGHQLGPGRMLVGGDSHIRTVRCNECQATMTSRHGSSEWTVS